MLDSGRFSYLVSEFEWSKILNKALRFEILWNNISKWYNHRPSMIDAHWCNSERLLIWYFIHTLWTDWTRWVRPPGEFKSYVDEIVRLWGVCQNYTSVQREIYTLEPWPNHRHVRTTLISTQPWYRSPIMM